MRKVDITGQKWARLTAVERVEGRKWKFRCDCGVEVVRIAQEVKGGNMKSCGCLNRERIIERNTKHGGAVRGARHPLYDLWAGMKARCADPAHEGYENYGGRGITVCARWMEFENFVTDMSPRPRGATLDRKDTNGNYEPSNCKWSTSTEQSENTSRNVYLTLKGERLTVSQWSRRLGIDQRTLNRRRYLGWDDERVLTTPVGGA